MRYKLLALAPILLLATPYFVFGQEMSPIIIKTGKPVPSVVRTGEPFKVTYEAKYLDSVLIVEEHIQPGNISVDQFEAVKLEVVTLPDDNDAKLGVVHIREFTYTFRIIKPEKGLKKIPSFDFIWVNKRAGVTEDETKQSSELHKMPTDEVGIGYTTSVVKPPPIDIRDEIVLPFLNWTGTELRRFSYASIAVFSLLALWVMVAWARSGRLKSRKADEKTAAETSDTEDVFDAAPNLLPKQARKKIIHELEVLWRSHPRRLLNGEDPREEEIKLYTLLREYILAELSEGPVRASVADTPKELYFRLSGLGAKQRKELGLTRYSAILGVSELMKNYYEDMESEGMHYVSISPAVYLEIISSVENLSWRTRIWRLFMKREVVKNA